MDAKTREFLSEFKKPKTVNEAITAIFNRDVKKGNEFVINRGWKFYVHLNKLTDPLFRKGYLDHVGEKYGSTNRLEKIWQLEKMP